MHRSVSLTCVQAATSRRRTPHGAGGPGGGRYRIPGHWIKLAVAACALSSLALLLRLSFLASTWPAEGDSANPPVLRTHGSSDASPSSTSLSSTADKQRKGRPPSELPGLDWESSGLPRNEYDVHVVFSSDCSNYQAWQSVVLFHSAFLAGHRGPITQLISGCGSVEKEEQIRESRRMWAAEVDRKSGGVGNVSNQWRLFFTETFSHIDPSTGVAYPYFNKPNAMLRWMHETVVEESVIALIDPDFAFLRPLSVWLNPKDVKVSGDGLSLEALGLESGAFIREGQPAGQHFELPAWWTWDLSTVCPTIPREDPEQPDTQGGAAAAAAAAAGGTATCKEISMVEARQYFNLIPPYVMHRRDWERLLPRWVDMAPKVYEIHPYLLAEQTAYSVAALSLDLGHYRLNNMALENEKVDFEGWSEVDRFMPTRGSSQAGKGKADAPLAWGGAHTSSTATTGVEPPPLSVLGSSNGQQEGRGGGDMITRDGGGGGPRFPSLAGTSVCTVAANITSAGVMEHFPLTPTFLHYCQMYRVGRWLFSKRRYMKDGTGGGPGKPGKSENGVQGDASPDAAAGGGGGGIGGGGGGGVGVEAKGSPLDCSQPLLAEPPHYLQNALFKLHPGKKWEAVAQHTAVRNTFMVCALTGFVNRALVSYKEAVCPQQQRQQEEEEEGEGDSGGSGGSLMNLDKTYRIT